MQIKIFTIPAFDNNNVNEELNKFLRSHRVLEVQQEFVATKNGAYWCYSVKYLQNNMNTSYSNKREKVDYRKVLDDKTFAVFEQLRTFRKEIAKKDAVPAYAVFIDAELSEIAKLQKISPESIKTIKGIGEKRVEKYGVLIAEMYNKK